MKITKENINNFAQKWYAKPIAFVFTIGLFASTLWLMGGNTNAAKAEKLSLDQLKQSVDMASDDWKGSQLAGQNALVQVCESQKAYAQAQRDFADAGGKDYSRTQAEISALDCNAAAPTFMPLSFL